MAWHSITFLGDSTLLLPSALLVFVVAAFSSRRRVAWQWALVFAAVGAIVCASKLAFMGWGVGIRSLDFTGFSGHTALSACFWPVFLWLVAGRLMPRCRTSAVVLGYILALVVGYSRLMVHAHSPAEVIFGLLLGCCGSATFLLLQRKTALPGISWCGLTAALLVPMVLFSTGAKAPTQSFLQTIAVQLSHSEKPFERGDLHNGRIVW